MSFVKEEKSWLEWLVFGVSGLIVFVVVAYLIRDGLKDQDRPPDIRIKLGKTYSAAHGSLVPVSVTNLGDQTAQSVEIEVRCVSMEQNSQEATLTYDFLASGEVREGCVGFYGKPGGRLSARVVGYRRD